MALVTAYLLSQITSSLVATRGLKGGQRGLMLALPLLFVGIVARFPAGLAVYWITTSLWSLGQQLCLRRMAPALPGPAVVAAPLPNELVSEPSQPRKRKRKRGRRR